MSVVLAGTTLAVVSVTDWPYRAPCAALSLWAAGMAGALTALLAGTYAFAAHPEAVLAHRLLGVPADFVALAVAWLFAARITFSFLRIHRAARKRRAKHRALLELFGRPSKARRAMVLPSRQPLAYSVPGPEGGHAVISDALLEGFTGPEVDSILAHERAHLTERHHLLTELCDAVRTALPRGQLTIRFAERFGALIEMRADCAARNRCGRHVTADALGRWTAEPTATVPAPPTRAAARTCPVSARRYHLINHPKCCSSLTAAGAFAAACSIAAAPVVLIGAGTLSALCALICG
ncbi:M56 family metallopeptidase [Streptomyces subrutilus]|uniref:M56 family metallopeptidase n=1 Tax=Streptomyces subrutilus TaxID=36818 RepID=UPI00114C9069|nr:M56 family metallopeptidase [Streptomyces subrutilus]